MREKKWRLAVRRGGEKISSRLVTSNLMRFVQPRLGRASPRERGQKPVAMPSVMSCKSGGAQLMLAQPSALASARLSDKPYSCTCKVPARVGGPAGTGGTIQVQFKSIRNATVPSHHQLLLHFLFGAYNHCSDIFASIATQLQCMSRKCPSLMGPSAIAAIFIVPQMSVNGPPAVPQMHMHHLSHPYIQFIARQRPNRCPIDH